MANGQTVSTTGIEHLLVRAIGWRATVLHGDPCVFDRWIWLKKHLLPGPLRTLDAGCGSGAFTLYAAKRGNEALGATWEEPALRRAQARAKILRLPNARFIQADLRELDRLSPSWGTFDQILCLETIEHLRDDRKLIRDLSNLLRAGGRLLLTTPYKHYRHLWGDRLSETEDGGHLRWGYTHEEIRQLFKERGLKVCQEDFISGFVSQQLTNLMRIFSRIHPLLAWGILLPMRILQIFDHPLTQWIGHPHLCVGVVGIKGG